MSSEAAATFKMRSRSIAATSTAGKTLTTAVAELLTVAASVAVANRTAKERRQANTNTFDSNRSVIAFIIFFETKSRGTGFVEFDGEANKRFQALLSNIRSA